MIKRGTAILAALVALSAAPAQAATQVPKDDWSYTAVQDLASQGLLEGYPKSAAIFGDRTVNRYEMATLISRVVDRVTNDPAAAKAAAPKTIDEISKLVQAYGVELAVLGTDVSNLKLGVASLTDTAIDHQKQLDKLAKTKVESGFGKIKFDGLLQAWYLAGSKEVTNFGSGQGTGLGISGAQNSVSNTFRIRRSELKFSGSINPQAYWVAMFDASKDQTVSSTPANTNGTAALQDLVVGWHLTPTIDFEVGQQKVPLSIEGYRSSANLLTIERSLMNTVPFGSGRVGDIRELGAWARYSQPGKANATIALLDDGGNRQNLVDDNSTKELMLNGQYFILPELQVGSYGEISGGVGANHNNRRRVGFDFDYVKAQHELTGEYVEGWDGGQATTGAAPAKRLKTQGSYVTYAYKLNKTWQAVARYDYFNINRDARQLEKDLTLGVNYFIAGNNSKIQLNYIKRNTFGPASANLGPSRYVYFTNFQQSF
ncbi:MAG TPA: porin [Capsulimonadaceae bacterium]|jgi:hypothetical protein